MTRRNDINQRLADELSGREKLAALLKAHGFTYASFARKYSRWPEQVKMCLDGTRPYPEIRDDLSTEIDLPREEIDRLIDDAPAKKDAAIEADRTRPEAA